MHIQVTWCHTCRLAWVYGSNDKVCTAACDRVRDERGPCVNVLGMRGGARGALTVST